MFEQMRRFDLIVVTGPQRSGTTIATKMIATDLDMEYVEEERFDVHYFHRLLPLLTGRRVIQAPALSAYCHLLPEEVAVVFMIRPVEEIQRSEQRVRWPEEHVELAKYFRTTGTIAQVKYDVWRQHQRPNIRHWFELKYAALQQHPLWIEDRAHFHSRQIG